MSAIFANPQFIVNPNYSASTKFSRYLAVHDAGFIAATDDQDNIYIYSINNRDQFTVSQIIPRNSISLNPADPANPNGLNNPNNADIHVTNISFMQAIGNSAEYYYMFVSVGLFGPNRPSLPPIPLTSGMSFSFAIFIFTYAQIPQAANESSTFVCTAYLSHPFPNSIEGRYIPNTLIVQKPFVASFGDKTRGIRDDNEPVVKQTLYSRGSEYSPQKPGGNIFMYILNQNQWIPNFVLNTVIRDSKLEILRLGPIFANNPLNLPQTIESPINTPGTIGEFILVGGGLGYTLNQIVKVNGGNNNAELLVTAVGAGGAITGLSSTPNQGTGYTIEGNPFTIAHSPLSPSQTASIDIISYSTLAQQASFYMNSFGVDFFVTTGNGRNNVLLVGNATNEDNGSINIPNVNQTTPCTSGELDSNPYGYAQLYVLPNVLVPANQQFLDPNDTPAWLQCTCNRIQPDFKNQHPEGFGYGTFVTDSRALIATSNSDPSIPIYTASSGSLNNNMIYSVNLTNVQITTKHEGYPKALVANVYNQTFLNIEGNIYTGTFSASPDGVALTANNPRPSRNGSNPYINLDLIQTFGQQGINSGANVNIDRVGFAQFASSLYSFDRRTIYLILNDPFYNADVGRMMIYRKAAT